MIFNNIKQKLFVFLRRVKPIAGLAITDDGLYVAVFSGATNTIVLRKKFAFDELTAENISKGLKKLKIEPKIDFSSVIVSLPSSESYTALFEFPLIAENKQIEEAMNLATSTLPVSEAEIYSDWMPLENIKTKKKEAVLEMAKKISIDSYLKIFDENKIAPVAIETYAWSLGQFLEEGDDIVMTVMEQFDSLIFIIYDGKIPYFHFILPKEIFNNEEDFLKSLIHHIKRLIHFVSSENNRSREIKSIIVLGSEELKKFLKENISGVDFKEIKGMGDSGELGHSIALGAAKRGLIPRREDAIVSLMPIGTELAYERHRLVSFLDFFQKFSIGFAGFLVVLFTGALVMVRALSLNVEKALQKEIIFPVEVAETRENAKFFNEAVAQMYKIQSASPLWQKVFFEVEKYANIGISISQISANENGVISFSGNAASRDSLIFLKNQITGSAVLDAEQLPLSLFLNKENINFTIRAKLKDANFLYQSI